MPTRIGCGSWADPEYLGLLGPPGLPAELRLAAYANWFDHVEVNASYYATPKAKAVAQWVKNTPAEFLFDMRLHRAFSMSPEKTAMAGTRLGYMLEGLAPMIEAKKLGTFLLVLSPFFAPGRHQLAELDALIEKIRPYSLAVELRHADWVSDVNKETTLEFFRSRAITWVTVDMPQIEDSELMPPIDEVTQPELAYLRLHGRNPKWHQLKAAAQRHAYPYNADELLEILNRIRVLEKSAKNVRVVANNHAFDFAPRTALALKEQLGQFDIFPAVNPLKKFRPNRPNTPCNPNAFSAVVR